MAWPQSSGEVDAVLPRFLSHPTTQIRDRHTLRYRGPNGTLTEAINNLSIMTSVRPRASSISITGRWMINLRNWTHYFAFVLVILLGPITKLHPVVNITSTVLQYLTLRTVVDKR
jgi:hypothetical protein